MIVRHLVQERGRPTYILTDNGKAFSSHKFLTLLQRLGIKHLRTTPYHPQTNGVRRGLRPAVESGRAS
jgi:transposase InsO family protein